jgi:hypothetical protein
MGYLSIYEITHFQGLLCRLGYEVNRAVVKDSFEIGKRESKRHGLSMAIFNLQVMFLSTHDPISLLFWDFWGDPVLCFFLNSSTNHFSHACMIWISNHRWYFCTVVSLLLTNGFHFTMYTDLSQRKLLVRQANSGESNWLESGSVDSRFKYCRTDGKPAC